MAMVDILASFIQSVKAQHLGDPTAMIMAILTSYIQHAYMGICLPIYGIQHSCIATLRWH